MSAFPRPGRTFEAPRAERTPDSLGRQSFGSRLRRAARRSGRQWHRFFLQGPGTEFAFYPPLPQRAVKVPIRGSLEPLDTAQDPERALGPSLEHLANLARVRPDVDGLALELSLGVAPDRRRSCDRETLVDLPRLAVDRLGWQRFLSVRCTGRSSRASIRLGRCGRRHWAPPGAWSFAEATLLSDPPNPAEAIADQLKGHVGWPAGAAVDVEVSYRLARDRDWTALWNATLHALPETGSREAAPHLSGDPLVAIGLHRRIDDEMGDRARIGIWWRAISGQGTATARPFAVAATAHDRLRSLGPSAMPPAFQADPLTDAHSSAARETLSVGEAHPPATISAGGVQDVLVFLYDDDGYLRWIAKRPGGYALNAIRRASSGSATLHRAACRLVAGDPSGGRRLTHNSAKVCSGSPSALVDWARRELGTNPSPCRVCRPI